MRRQRRVFGLQLLLQRQDRKALPWEGFFLPARTGPPTVEQGRRAITARRARGKRGGRRRVMRVGLLVRAWAPVRGFRRRGPFAARRRGRLFRRVWPKGFAGPEHGPSARRRVVAGTAGCRRRRMRPTGPDRCGPAPGRSRTILPEWRRQGAPAEPRHWFFRPKRASIFSRRSRAFARSCPRIDPSRRGLGAGGEGAGLQNSGAIAQQFGHACIIGHRAIDPLGFFGVCGRGLRGGGQKGRAAASEGCSRAKASRAAPLSSACRAARKASVVFSARATVQLLMPL